MRLREFAGEGEINTPEANLETALELIRFRSKDKDNPNGLTIKTNQLINLVRNTDRTFDYDSLVNANENNPALKNIIKSFNKDEVTLAPYGGDEPDDTTTNVDDASTTGPVSSVGDMAKRAAKKRDSDIF